MRGVVRVGYSGDVFVEGSDDGKDGYQTIKRDGVAGRELLTGSARAGAIRCEEVGVGLFYSRLKKPIYHIGTNNTFNVQVWNTSIIHFREYSPNDRDEHL